MAFENVQAKQFNNLQHVAVYIRHHHTQGNDFGIKFAQRSLTQLKRTQLTSSKNQ
jgi:hypothetical protein